MIPLKAVHSSAFMRLLFPQIRFALLLPILRHAAIGAGIAGIYGILHDQITYSISEEYFICVKFHQFAYANFGFPSRIFVAEIGFLATWWVGFLAGWFMARVTVPAFPPGEAARRSARGFLIMLAFAFAGSFFGYVAGLLHGPDFSSWDRVTSQLGILDTASFVRVAYIHNASYLGALIGLIIAIIYLRRLRRRSLPAE